MATQITGIQRRKSKCIGCQFIRVFSKQSYNSVIQFTYQNIDTRSFTHTYRVASALRFSKFWALAAAPKTSRQAIWKCLLVRHVCTVYSVLSMWMCIYEYFVCVCARDNQVGKVKRNWTTNYPAINTVWMDVLVKSFHYDILPAYRSTLTRSFVYWFICWCCCCGYDYYYYYSASYWWCSVWCYRFF